MFSDKRFHNYSLRSVPKDLLSGLIVGVIAIPLGMAFAIASGVKPEYGIYTTIVAGFLFPYSEDRSIKLVDQQERLFPFYLELL